MNPDEAEQHARMRFLNAGTAFFRAGQVAAWAGVFYALVAVVQRVSG
jgi:negative regulator of sigma E activity